MRDQITLGEKAASPSLSLMLRQAATQITDFTKTWSEIVEHGRAEDFDEKELIQMFKPLVRDQLTQMGLEPRQINQKIYYLVHREDILENKSKRDNAVKKSLNVQTDETGWTDKSALDEIARLQTQLNEANETIKNVSFNDNPDVFSVRKDSDYYFAGITVEDAAKIITTQLDHDVKVNVAWEIVG